MVYSERAMRDFLGFLVFLAAIFLVVGEFFGGWYLGVLPQTPAFVYNKTHTATVTRRTLSDTAEFPFKVSGRLRNGSLTVEAVYERPVSYQGRTDKPVAPRIFVTETFLARQPIYVADTLEKGWGIYQVRLIFEDATGTIRVEVPDSSTF